jgi:gas vesicle protein
MKRLSSWTVAAACAIAAVAGLSALPASAQEVREDRQDIRQDRTALRGARQQLRDAYKSGDPGAVKAARENLQKTRSSLHRDLAARRASRP